MTQHQQPTRRVQSRRLWPYHTPGAASERRAAHEPLGFTYREVPRAQRPCLCAWGLLGVVCLSLFAASAHAQTDARSLQSEMVFLVRSSQLREVAAPTSSNLRVTTPAALSGSLEEANTRFRQNRARRILAAGTGFLLAAAITPAYVLQHRQSCYGSSRPKGAAPLKGAAWLGGIGLVAAIGGGTWLALEARRHGHYTSRRERIVAGSIGAVTFVLGQLLLGTVFFVDQICND